MARIGRLCAYCERKMTGLGHHDMLSPTRDHVLPKSQGGSGYAARIVWACRLCNNLKGDLLPEEWSDFMRAYPRWWEWDQFKYGGTDNARLALRQIRS